jgi:enoyl-CoA hydratase/carnithine racemase
MGIKYEKRNQIAYITIDNPERANVLDRATSDELSEAWKSVWEDSDVRVSIVTGTGDRHFCAGHNLKSRPDITDEEREYFALRRVFWPHSGSVNGSMTGVDGRMGDHFPQIWKPVIAAVNGWAAGAGFYMILSSTDIRIASAENARFKFALLSNGWVGGGPGATLLGRQIRYADAMRILLMDEPFGAEEALRIGLVNEVVPHEDLMSRAEELATHITALPPLAVRMMKEFQVRFREVPVDAAWQMQSLMNSLLIQTTADGEEGRKAFVEKRPPNFTGAFRKKGDVFPERTPEEQERLDRIYRSREY